MRILNRPIFWILLFALGLRLWGVTYGFPLFLINDETPHVYGALKMIELKTLIPAFHQEEFKKVLYYPPLLSYFYLAALSPVIAVHYLLSGAQPLADYKALLALDPSFIWMAARVWMVLIGLADIFVIYLLSRKLFQSERAACLAAAFLALSFWHLQLSHNVRHWLPAAFLISILWYLSVRISEGGAGFRTYISSGLVAGLAAGGVNTSAVVGLIPLLFAHFYPVRTPPTPVGGKNRNSRWECNAPIGRSRSARSNGVYHAAPDRLKAVILSGSEGSHNFKNALATRFFAALRMTKRVIDIFFGGLTKKLFVLLAVFLLSAGLMLTIYPYGFTRAEGAATAGQDILGRMTALAGKEFISWFKFIAAYLGAFWKYETPLFFAALLGLALAYIRGMRFWVNTVLLFAVILFSLIYLFDDFTTRAVILVLPIFAVFAGYAADFLLKKGKEIIEGRFILLLTFYFLLFTLFFGWQLITDFRYQWLLSQKDTRLVARDWVLENIPAGAKIVMDSQYLRLPNTEEGVREIQAIDPAGLRAQDFALITLAPERRPYPAYAVLNLNFISTEIRRKISADGGLLSQRGFEYMIVEYAAPQAVPEDVRRLIGSAEPLKRFSGWKKPQDTAYDGSGKINGLSIAKLFDLERFGLFVDIYRL